MKRNIISAMNELLRLTNKHLLATVILFCLMNNVQAQIPIEIIDYQHVLYSTYPINLSGTHNTYQKCEYIIPASFLSAIESGSCITAMDWVMDFPSYYAGTPSLGNYTIFLKEVENTYPSSYVGPDDATIVYQGQLNYSSRIKIQFDTPFAYNGGNLLVGVYRTGNGTSYYSGYFKGRYGGAGVIGTANFMSQINYSNSTHFSFLPETYISYTPNYVIPFLDSYVKEICVANWDTDGDSELNVDEASSVTDLGEVFKNNSSIFSLNSSNVISFI